jgi:hypothetical protein
MKIHTRKYWARDGNAYVEVIRFGRPLQLLTAGPVKVVPDNFLERTGTATAVRIEVFRRG